MPSATKIQQDAVTAFTITLASLANGSARQSTMVSNATNKRPAALVYLRIKSGAAAPTVNTVYNIFLLRGDNVASSTYRTDGAGASDAAFTRVNAPLLGSILVTASANTNFYGEFDTGRLGPLGDEWGIAVLNSSGQALSTTEGDHLYKYSYYYPEAQ